jgi:hypothetical protein
VSAGEVLFIVTHFGSIVAAYFLGRSVERSIIHRTLPPFIHHMRRDIHERILSGRPMAWEEDEREGHGEKRAGDVGRV